MAAQHVTYVQSSSSFKDRIPSVTAFLGCLPRSVIQLLARLGVGAVFLEVGALCEPVSASTMLDVLLPSRERWAGWGLAWRTPLFSRRHFAKRGTSSR